MNKPSKKILSLTLAVLLALGSVTIGMPLAAQAAAGIQEGTPTFTRNQTVVGFGGHEWYVIDTGSDGVTNPGTGHITLLAKNSFGTSPYNNESGGGSQAIYANKNLHNAMQNIYSSLSANERVLISPREIDNLWDGTGGFNTNATLSDQYLWPLSHSEYQTMGTISGDTFSGLFWLRSPGPDNYAWLGVPGGGNNLYADVYYPYAVRPALYLNLSSVLFTSDASGASAKSSVGVAGGLVGASAPGANLKFTMPDTSMATPSITNSSGMDFSFSGAETGPGNYLSCVLVGTQGADDGVVKYYGKLADCSTSASGSFTLPLTGVNNGTYTLKIFGEQANGNNETDFAGPSVDMTLTVASGGGEIVEAPAITAQPTAQAVTEGNTATFTVTATGDSLSYQWQVKTGSGFAAVNDGTGGNTASYTTPVTTTTMNGWEYRVQVSNAAATVTSNATALTVSSSDTTPPAITTITPADNATDIDISGNIVITFNEPMKTTAGAVSLSGGSGSVNTTGAWSTATSANDTFTIGYSGLAESTQYTISISGFQDASGNEMNAITSGYTFTTLTSDTTPPAIATITPADNATDIDISGNIAVVFGETMDTSVGAVSLSGGSGSVNTTGAWSAATSANDTFTVGYSGLAYSTEYTITISGFQDAAGNVMTSDSGNSFTTRAQPTGPDVSPATLNLDLNGISSGSLTVSLGQPGNQAGQAGIAVDSGYESDISVNETTLTADGTVTVTGLQAVSGAGITVTFSGGTATATSVPITVDVTDSTTYTITFDANGGSVSSAALQTGADGKLPSLPAAIRTNYSFDGWYTEASGGAQITASTVFTGNDTVYAHWTYTGGSGSHSGGNSGSNDSDNSSTPKVTVTPAAQPDQPTIGSVSGEVGGTNTQAAFTVTDSIVKAALEKAQAEAKAQNRAAYGVGVRIELDTPATAGLTVTLDRAALNRLVSTGAKRFELTGMPISLAFDAQALAELQKQSTGAVTITVKPATVTGIRNAYNITISYIKDGKTVNITSLGSGSATLSIPCAPGKNEAAGYLYVVYVDGNGKLNHIADSSYNTNSGSVICSTDHFSVYGVGYTAPSAKFTDTAKHWAAESIDYAVGRGLLSGTAETTFSPNTAMSRGMLVTALGRLAGVDTKLYTTNSFTDVKADSVFRPYIEWAYKKGIVQGIGNSQFAPDRAVTREEIAVIFANYAKATGYTLPVTREATAYADASSIGNVYKTAVTAMQQAGIMMGGSGNKFNPKSNATRAEVSAMLHRYIKLTIDPATAQGWALNDAGQYLYYKDGKAVTGTQTIDGVKYYFNTNGTLKTGWLQDDSGNWHFYSGNKLLTGWWDIGANGNNKRYYCDTYGNMVSGKWLQIDAKWYYFYADGSLAVSAKIDEYEVDENGVRKTK